MCCFLGRWPKCIFFIKQVLVSYGCTHTQICIHKYIYIYTDMHTYKVYTYITLHYIKLHYITLHTYIYIYIYTNLYIYIYTYLYIYIYIHIYIYIYIYSHIKLGWSKAYGEVFCCWEVDEKIYAWRMYKKSKQQTRQTPLQFK